MTGPRIKHPVIALVVYFGVGVVLYTYGVDSGTMLILDVLLGLAIYKLITAHLS